MRLRSECYDDRTLRIIITSGVGIFSLDSKPTWPPAYCRTTRMHVGSARWGDDGLSGCTRALHL